MLYSNQANAEPRKMQLNSGKACGIFTCQCPAQFPAWQLVWRQQLIFPVWDWGPWFQREQSRLYSLITVFVYSLLPGNFLKYGCKVLRSVSPNSELIQGGIAVEIGWKCCNTNDEKPCRSLGQKIMADSCNRPPRFSEEKLEREFLWKIRVIRNTSVYGII